MREREFRREGKSVRQAAASKAQEEPAESEESVAPDAEEEKSE